jgi:hypothetical protein
MMSGQAQYHIFFLKGKDEDLTDVFGKMQDLIRLGQVGVGKFVRNLVFQKDEDDDPNVKVLHGWLSLIVKTTATGITKAFPWMYRLAFTPSTKKETEQYKFSPDLKVSASNTVIQKQHLKRKRVDGSCPTNKNQRLDVLMEDIEEKGFAQTVVDTFSDKDETDYWSLLNEAKDMIVQKETAAKLLVYQERAKDFMNNLFPWQTQLLEILNQEPDDRHIWWVYDEEGNTGKSTFRSKYYALYGSTTVLLNNGKDRDMCHVAAVKPSARVYFLDLPRSTTDINWNAIELIKNGTFTSNKYHGVSVANEPGHFVIFANRLPDFAMLSQDRWRVMHITADKIGVVSASPLV